jgi:hypothetical protein
MGRFSREGEIVKPSIIQAGIRYETYYTEMPRPTSP